jgi:ankyrin repeat protein
MQMQLKIRVMKNSKALFSISIITLFILTFGISSCATLEGVTQSISNGINKLTEGDSNGGQSNKTDNSKSSACYNKQPENLRWPVLSSPAVKAEYQRLGSMANQQLLVRAVEEKNVVSVKKYLAKGARPELADDTAFNNEGSALTRAYRNGCKECWEAMLPKVRDINFCNGKETAFPLVAACNRDIGLCKTLVEQYGANPNARGSSSTPMREITNPAALEYLIGKGANPNLGEYPGYHQLGLFISKRDYDENYKWEAYRGAILAYRDNGGDHYGGFKVSGLIYYGKTKSEFDYAIWLINNDIVKIDCYNMSNSTTDLAKAVEKNRYDIAKALLEKGANPNQHVYAKPSNNGTVTTVLSYAVRNGSDQRIINLIEEYGGK